MSRPLSEPRARLLKTALVAHLSCLAMFGCAPDEEMSSDERSSLRAEAKGLRDGQFWGLSRRWNPRGKCSRNGDELPIKISQVGKEEGVVLPSGETILGPSPASTPLQSGETAGTDVTGCPRARRCLSKFDP